MLNKSEKLEILQLQLDMLKEQMELAVSSLKQAQEDWCILNSCDGDRLLVKKPPILSVCDAQVTCEMAIGFLGDMERVIEQ